MPLLIPSFWLAAFLALYGSWGRARHSLLASYTAVGVLVLASAELLSLADAVTATGVSVVWMTAIAATLWFCRRSTISAVDQLRRHRAKFTSLDWAFAAIMLLLCSGTLAAALLYPPANYDSLTHHMPRVFFWIQNQSIDPFATSSGQHLFSGSLVPYFMLHLKLLFTGSDRLVGLAQWSAYVMSIVAVSLISEKLGAARRGQQVAALAAATTPMAVLQASTTQTDLMTAVWCLTLAYCLLAYITDGAPSRAAAMGWAAWAGTSVGLATQSKASAYLVCAPLLLWAAVAVGRRDGWARIGRMALVAALLVLLVNAGHFTRNALLLGGDIIASRAPGMAHILIQDRRAEPAITNALKNTSMLLATPFERLNRIPEATVRAVVAAYGGDIENPLTSEAPSGEYRLDPRVTVHDVGPAPVSVLLALLSAAMILPARRRYPMALWYAACALSALFLTAALVSWNLFINRVLLGPILLLMPLAGVAVTSALERGKRSLVAPLVALVCFAVLWAGFVMAFNSTHRLVPPSLAPALPFQRDLGYWNTHYDELRFRVLVPHLEAPFKAAADAVEEIGAKRVGIHDHIGHFPVYPLLYLLEDREVGYVRNLVLEDQIGDLALDPEVIIEIIPADEFAKAMGDDTRRGALLIEPQHADDHAVLLVYRAP